MTAEELAAWLRLHGWKAIVRGKNRVVASHGPINHRITTPFARVYYRRQGVWRLGPQKRLPEKADPLDADIPPTPKLSSQFTEPRPSATG